MKYTKFGHSTYAFCLVPEHRTAYQNTTHYAA